MNLWKKAVAMVMCLGLSFSMFGCQPKNESSSSSDTGSVGGSDNVTESTSEPEDSSDIVIPEDAESFFDVVQTAKSANIKVEIDTEVTTLYEGEDKFDKGIDRATITLDMIVSENENGGADAEIRVTSSSSGVSSNGEAYDGDAMEQTLYIIDGYTYIWQEDGYYTKSATTVDVAIESALAQSGVPLEELQSILDELSGALTESGFSTDDLIGALEGEFDATAKIEDGALMTTIDLTDDINGILDYLGTLNEETIVGDVVNDILGLIDPTLNYADILDMVAPLGAMTVSEAYTEIDTAFEAEMGLGLQDYKDLMIMNASVISALKDAGLTTEDIQAISAFSFEEDFLAPYGEYTLNAFIVEITAMEDAPEDFIGEVCALAKEYLSTATLGELEAALEAEGMLETIAIISQLEFTALEEKFGVKYDDDYKVEAGIFITNIGFEMEEYMETSTGAVVRDKNEASFSVKVTVSEISEEKVTIDFGGIDFNVVVQLCYGCGDYYMENKVNIEFREDISAHICDDCYPTYIYECCWDCCVYAEDVIYRDDLGYNYCDECYAANTAVTE